VVVETPLGTGVGRGVLGVVDGSIPKGLEDNQDRAWRKKLLRDIGYKL
jgi:adenosine/AMP kinase